VQAARKANVKRGLDINVEDKSHLVYDTKYTSRKANTGTTTATTTATITATITATAAALMRYVWHWIALGLMALAG
jgi:hypothetical protein